MARQLSLFENLTNFARSALGLDRSRRPRRQARALGYGPATHDDQPPSNLQTVQKRPRSPRQRSDQELQQLWLRLRQQYFPERPDIDSFRITWSARSQKRVLGSCNLRHRRVIIARELQRPETAQWVEAVVYHEMCHAIIGLGVHLSGSRRRWHGPQFRAIERLHPLTIALDHWIKSGGWRHAVRSDRSHRAHQRKTSRA